MWQTQAALHRGAHTLIEGDVPIGHVDADRDRGEPR